MCVNGTAFDQQVFCGIAGLRLQGHSGESKAWHPSWSGTIFTCLQKRRSSLYSFPSSPPLLFLCNTSIIGVVQRRFESSLMKNFPHHLLLSTSCAQNPTLAFPNPVAGQAGQAACEDFDLASDRWGTFRRHARQFPVYSLQPRMLEILLPLQSTPDLDLHPLEPGPSE